MSQCQANITILGEHYRAVYGGKYRRMINGVCCCGKEMKMPYSPSGIYPDSCGCLQRPYKDKTKYRKMLNSYISMKNRCLNPKHQSYKFYEKKGITICDRWRVFKNFYDDMEATWKLGLELDRYPNRNGNYEPGNVRWATEQEQQRNKDCVVLKEEDVAFIRSSNMLQSELAEKYKVNQSTISRVINKKRW